MKCIVSKWQEKEGNELTANDLVRVNSNKPEFGSLMLISQSVSLSSGFLNKRNIVGFVTGRVEDLKEVIKSFNLKEGTDYSVAVGPHRIVTLEKMESELTDADLGFRDKINPTTGEVLKKNGSSIQWKTEVVAEGSDLSDRYIEHDRVVVVDPAVAEFTGEAADKKQ
jgi:hypothetical protein